MKNILTALTRSSLLARWACIASLWLVATLSHAQVGMRQMMSGDMPITVLYPTAASNQAVAHGPFTIQAAIDAAPLPASPGSRRLIVLSHGTAGSTDNDHGLAATLVRAGFVVAQPLHRGDNIKDFSRNDVDYSYYIDAAKKLVVQ
jgi:predicted dienelactone hydrolase